MTVSIAHVTIEARRPARWRAFLADITGGADVARVVWTDDLTTLPPHHGLRITEGRSNDLALLGLAFAGEAALGQALARLTAAGVPWRRVAAPAGARLAVHCADPAGNALELLVVDAPAADPRWPVGHVALTHRDHGALTAFYETVIGLRLNERTHTSAGPLELHGSFLGSARHHHTIAILDVPSTRRLHHVFFGAPSVAVVEQAWAAARAPMAMTLGQHSQPDGTTSFYAASPSGFDVEIGAGGNLLDATRDAAPLQGGSTSSWGHEVTLRARLRVVGALALQRLGLAA